MARRKSRPSLRKRIRIGRSKLGLLVLALVIFSFFVLGDSNPALPFLGLSKCSSTSSAHSQPIRIGLLDSLSSEYPNPQFVEEMRSLSNHAGYVFDYIPSYGTNLDSYVNLPNRGYELLIFRSHSGYASSASVKVAITTSQTYHEYERLGDQLTDKVTPVKVNGTLYFGITANFVSSLMCGRFPGTIVLAMGCSTMVYDSLAKAFVGRGASAFIGWDGTVTVSHTDMVFESLVGFLLRGSSVGQAIQDLSGAAGTGPESAKLSYYVP